VDDTLFNFVDYDYYYDSAGLEMHPHEQLIPVECYPRSFEWAEAQDAMGCCPPDTGLRTDCNIGYTDDNVPVAGIASSLYIAVDWALAATGQVSFEGDVAGDRDFLEHGQYCDRQVTVFESSDDEPVFLRSKGEELTAYTKCSYIIKVEGDGAPAF